MVLLDTKASGFPTMACFNPNQAEPISASTPINPDIGLPRVRLQFLSPAKKATSNNRPRHSKRHPLTGTAWNSIYIPGFISDLQEVGTVQHQR
jgi:hypothetical protein